MKPRHALLALPLLFACSSTEEHHSREVADTAADSFEVIPLEYASAPELAATLTGLVSDATQDTDGARIKIMTDQRTNSLLVLASPEHMAHLKELIVRLDVKVGE